MIEFTPTEWESPCKRFSISKATKGFDLSYKIDADEMWEHVLAVPTFDAAVKLANALAEAFATAE
jgi:hypothetical protein